MLTTAKATKAPRPGGNPGVASGVGEGAVPLVITVDGVDTQAGATVAVRSAPRARK